MGEPAYAPMEHDETLKLICAAQNGDTEAADILTAKNLALVRSVARRYINRGQDYDDLVQIGALGLIKAIRNFNADFGTRFSTYAVPMIAGEIKRFLRDDGMVKVSRQLKELAYHVAKASERLSIALGRSPRIEEIALELAVAPEEVAEALDAITPHCSIYEPVFGDDSDQTRADMIPCKEVMETEATDRVMLKELLSTLSPRDRRLIWLRYFCDKTQSDTARELNISQVQVSRLEGKILASLRATAQNDSGA